MMGGGGPPPPPPPMMGGGGPPPPPPMMGGPPPPPGMGGPPMPPGMGMPMANPLPKLPNFTPSVPLKGIFWNKINNNKVSNTIWMKKDICKNQSDVMIDAEEIDKLFAKKAAKAVENTGPKKPEKISLIDPKKAQNSAIVLGSMRMDFKVIRKAILDLDEEVLTLEQIKALKDIAPTSDEVAAVNEYTGDYDLLGPTEQFYKNIVDIPRLDQRLTCWMFKIKFPSAITNVAPDIENLLTAAKQMLDADLFHGLLEKILAVGNYLNTGKAVYGFEMSALNKLKDTKATGARIDLLRYILLFVEKQYPQLMGWVDQLDRIEAATRVSTTNVQNELNELQTGLNQVLQEVDLADQRESGERDLFSMTMKEFIADSSDRLAEEQANYQKMMTTLNELRDAYGEDPKKYKPEEFVANMHQFILTWKETLADILRKREMEEKKAEREARKNKAKEESEKKTLVKKTPLSKKAVVDSEADGIVEKTLSGLVDGTAFTSAKKETAAKKTGVVAKKGRKNAGFDADSLLKQMMEKEKTRGE